MARRAWTALAVGATASFLLAAVYSFLVYSLDRKGCEMTYMYPDYVLQPEAPRSRPGTNYRLYLYQEGYTRREPDDDRRVGGAEAYKRTRS
jgi:hypothetical protein